MKTFCWKGYRKNRFSFFFPFLHENVSIKVRSSGWIFEPLGVSKRPAELAQMVKCGSDLHDSPWTLHNLLHICGSITHRKTGIRRTGMRISYCSLSSTPEAHARPPQYNSKTYTDPNPAKSARTCLAVIPTCLFCSELEQRLAHHARCRVSIIRRFSK